MNKFDFTLIFCPRWGVEMPWTAPAFLLEAVRSKGFSAQYLDYNIRLYRDNQTPELWEDDLQYQFWQQNDLNYFVNQIDLNEIQSPVVGFSITGTNIRFSVALARKLKEVAPDKTVLFGGHGVFFADDQETYIPFDACDAIIKGEGEVTLIDILENGLNKTIGTCTPVSNKWFFHGERPLIKELDAFPWPRYDDVDWHFFPKKELSLMGSKGCINRCVFCDDIVRAEHQFRKRSAEHIAEEMLYHKEKSGIGFMVFNDPIVNAHYKNLERLCDILIEKKFNQPWAANFAIRRNMPLSLMKKLKQAGFSAAVIGLESGSQKVLDLMKKGFLVDDARWFIKSLSEAGIQIDLNIVVGFPGETEEDFEQTLQLITELSPSISQIVSICTLNVGHSYLLDHLSEFNIEDLPADNWYTNWTTTDGKNTYEIRCERAKRLIQLAQELNLAHVRFDLDLMREDRLLCIEDVQKRKMDVSQMVSLKCGKRPVYLWGAGKSAEQSLNTLNALGFRVDGFIDADSGKWNTSIEGIFVFSPSTLQKKRSAHELPFVVVGSMHFKEISSQLKKYGYKLFEDFHNLQYFASDYFLKHEI